MNAIPQRARFFKDNGRDFVEISFVGTKDTLVKKVAPEHMAKFRAEWDAYCDGRPPERRAGTPLTRLVQEQRAEHYIQRNIHNVEELAALDDVQCQGVGHGTITDREHARRLLEEQKLEREVKARERITNMTAAAAPASSQVGDSGDLTEIKQNLAALANSMQALITALTPRPPGRPRKHPRREHDKPMRDADMDVTSDEDKP